MPTVPLVFRSSTRVALRRCVIWWLAAFVPLQGMAATALTTLGPAHVHAAVTGAPLELGDFRRAAARPAARPTHLDTVFGHFHGVGTPLRHPHARGDASVVLVPQQAGDADEPSISPTLAVFVALLPSAALWSAPRSRGEAASRPLWAPRTHDPEPFERPPRVA